jgi:RNA polymerase sigma-70 factor (ECF subfamily)
MTPQPTPTPPLAAPSAASDEEIVRRVVAGETALFEVLMRRHNPRVYRAIRAILRDEAEAEDAMQQAYLHAYAGLRAFEGASAFSTWLVRIAMNEALGRVRKSARLLHVEDLPEEAEGDHVTTPRENPEERAEAREAVRILERTIDRLPLPYRTVIMLRDVQQLTTEEAAEALGISGDAVKVRLHRARLVLRERVAETLGRGAAEAFPFLAPRCDRVVAGVMAAIAAGAR